MIRHAGDRMIPVTTQIPPDKLQEVHESLARRKKWLRKQRNRNGNAEEVLFVMEEVEHIEALLKNQKSTPETKQ